jgi:drug/metabolite transporter (DMT)-like permease
MDNKMWLFYAVLAGLCWGTYVPFVQQGIKGLGMNALGSFLCVGVAYFLIAILYPIAMFAYEGRTPAWNAYGISFATMAGVAGALGALCVILANRAAGRGSDYKMYIAPIIFGLAPLLNTLISLVWHADPDLGPGSILDFGLKHVPDWKLFVGIVFIGLGAALVLYSKEETEKLEQQVSKQTAAALAAGHAKPQAAEGP